MSPIPLLPLVAALLSLTQVNAIQFNLSTPTQCDPLTVEWTNKEGSRDMYLLVMPAQFVNQGLIRNYSIPASASSPYTIPGLANPAGLEFVATLVDGSGFEGTGVSDVLTVGSSLNGNSSCLPAVAPDPDFFFYTDPTGPISVNQCGNIRITWQNSYTLPTSIVGLIPGGEIFTIHEVTGPNQGGGDGQPGDGYDWKVNTQGGNGVILYMRDSGPIGTGGSTELFTVGDSSDSSCLSDDSPSTISPATTVSGVGGGGGRPTSGAGSEGGSGGSSSSSGSTNTGAIIGGAVGGAACLVLLAILLFLFFRRRARQVNDPHHPRHRLVGSYGTAGAGAIGSKEDDAEKAARRRSSVVDLLSGDKAGRTGAGAGATAAVIPPMAREDSGETETYEPSPYFSGVPASFNGYSTDPTSSPTQASRYRQSGETDVNRMSNGNLNGMIGDLDFGSNSGLGMSGYGRRPSDTEASTQSGMRTDQAALSHSGATIAPRPRVDSTPDDPSTNSSPMGTAGRSNSTRKPRPAVGTTGGANTLPSAPTRFVLHTDAGGMEDAEPRGPDENGVVDIPPTYDSLGNVNNRS